MPPQLALLIGCVLVAYAFISDRHRDTGDSRGLLWPTIWYLDVASRPFGFWMLRFGIPIPGGSGDPTEGSVVDRFFFLTLAVVGLIILSRRSFPWRELLRRNPWIAVLLAYMALSILWSAFPFVSFKRYIKVLGSVVMAMVVLWNDRPLDSTFTVLRRCLYIHIPMSIICIKYFRDIGVSYDWDGNMHMWNGIATSKNTLGQVAMVGVIYFFWEVRRNWHKYKWRNLHLAYLAMSVYLLKGSPDAISMTSVSVCAFAMAIFVRLHMLRDRPPAARRFARTAFLATAALVSLILLHSVVMFSADSVFGRIITALGRNITLTDRTYIWHDVYAAASHNPLFGVGYGGFWIGRLANIPWNASMTWVLAEAHDGYIDTYLQLGLLGGALLAIVLFKTLPRLLDQLDSDFEFATFRITLLVTIMFINITESSYLRGDHNLWFVMQLAIWMAPSPADFRKPEADTDGAPEAVETTLSELGDDLVDTARV